MAEDHFLVTCSIYVVSAPSPNHWEIWCFVSKPGCALSKNGASIIIFRLLGGLFAAAPLTNSGYGVVNSLIQLFLTNSPSRAPILLELGRKNAFQQPHSLSHLSCRCIIISIEINYTTPPWRCRNSLHPVLPSFRGMRSSFVWKRAITHITLLGS